ncbi:DUF1131 family protein [Martelella lutilitoris]|uniref:DUF1131 family protein n=1 Tax=Martelella lutilitoris TaxID=2583532 RepID=UPI0016516972|nr:DUF1131 family protein [Martelella lutilitoris]
MTAALADAGDAPIIVTESGVGGIDGRTPFAADAVGLALPGFDVRAEKHEGEGGFYSVFIAASAGVDTITLYGGETVVRADIAAPDAVTEAGARIGDLFSDVFSGDDERYCEPGMEVFSGKAVCLAPGSAQIALVFGGSWDGPDGTLPDAAKLARWPLEIIIWNAEF